MNPLCPDLLPKPFIFLGFIYTGQRHFPEIQVFGSKDFYLESTGIMTAHATPFIRAVKTATYLPSHESKPILCPILQQTFITSVFLQYSYYSVRMCSHCFLRVQLRTPGEVRAHSNTLHPIYMVKTHNFVVNYSVVSG